MFTAPACRWSEVGCFWRGARGRWERRPPGCRRPGVVTPRRWSAL